MLFDILLVAALFAHLSSAQICTFCENGITNPSVVFNEIGDQTCAEIPILIAGELEDSMVCSSFKAMENLCCPSSCTFCENGVTNLSLVVPEGGNQTCAEVKLFSFELASDDELCAQIKINESSCCPGTSSTSPTASSLAFTGSPTAAASLLLSLSPTSKPSTSQPTWPPTNKIDTSSPTVPVTLPPIEVIETPPTGVISGVAFYDSNNNGNRESLLEYGVWDIKVSLYACGDDTTPLAKTSTSTQGTYQIENLAEGTYYIKFEHPSYYSLGRVWNGDASTTSVANAANPDSGKTNCFTLNSGDQFEADVAFTANTNPAPATNPPPTAVATPTPTAPVITPPPSDATPTPTAPVNTPPPTVTTAQASESPTTAVIVSSSPTAQSVENATICAFCEDGIPDPDNEVVGTGQTCDAMKTLAANEGNGTNTCVEIQQMESSCCPASLTSNTTLSPTYTPTQSVAPTLPPDFLSKNCTFCEDGMIDANFEIDDKGGETCGTHKDRADALNGLTPLCARIQEAEDVCCPGPVTNPCSFCDGGNVNLYAELPESGNRTCGTVSALAATIEQNSSLCTTLKQAEIDCCQPTLSPTSSPAPSAKLPDLVGPVTTDGIVMILKGIGATEQYRVWQDSTASFIADYFSKNTDIVYEMNVVVTMVFESTIADIQPRGAIRRQLQETSTPSVKITYTQSTTYRTQYPDSYVFDPDYIVEQPFKEDPGGYIAWLKNVSSHYDPVSDVTVTVSSPTPPPSPPASKSAPVKKSTESNIWEDNKTYFIIGIACGGVALIGVVAGIVICCKRKRRNERQERQAKPVKPVTSFRLERRWFGCCRKKNSGLDPPDIPKESDEDWRRRVSQDPPDSFIDVNSRDTSDLFESSGVVAAAAALSILPRDEVLVHVVAPAGRLGVVVDTPTNGGPSYVIDLRDDSPLLGQVHLGDKIIAVDDDDVQQMSAMDVSKLLARKSRNPQRKITTLRKGEQGEGKNSLVAVSSSQYSYSEDAVINNNSEEQGEGGNALVAVSSAQYSHSEDAVVKNISEDAVTISNREDDVATSNSERTVTIIAPTGKLGVVVENKRDGGPAYVSEIREGSPLEGKIQLNDRIVSIDDEDVRKLKAFHISKLLAYKSQNKERTIVVLRGTVGASRNMTDDSSTFTNTE